MSEKRFTYYYERGNEVVIEDNGKRLSNKKVVELLNEQQQLIEELQVSDEMGWKRAERFEKKCPKELHNKKMYIKRLEYKVQKFKEMNKELKFQLDECANNKLYSRRELEKENEQLRKQVGELQKIIDLTSYQLKVQDRILKEVGE